MITLNVTGGSLNEVLEQLRSFFTVGGTVVAETAKPEKVAKSIAAEPKSNAAQTGGSEITKETVRAAWAEKKDAGVKLDKMKTLLSEYGVTKLDELAEEHYAAVHAKVLKLTV